MTHGVFDNRLQDHVRDERVCRVRVGDNPDLQAILEPYPLDREIQPQELQLTPERHLLSLDVVEGETQHVAKLRDHVFGLLRLLLPDQDRDRAERVEEKVRCGCMFNALSYAADSCSASWDACTLSSNASRSRQRVLLGSVHL
jgi:hypothetical protein